MVNVQKVLVRQPVVVKKQRRSYQSSSAQTDNKEKVFANKAEGTSRRVLKKVHYEIFQQAAKTSEDKELQCVIHRKLAVSRQVFSLSVQPQPRQKEVVVVAPAPVQKSDQSQQTDDPPARHDRGTEIIQATLLHAETNTDFPPLRVRKEFERH